MDNPFFFSIGVVFKWETLGTREEVSDLWRQETTLSVTMRAEGEQQIFNIFCLHLFINWLHLYKTKTPIEWTRKIMSFSHITNSGYKQNIPNNELKHKFD